MAIKFTVNPTPVPNGREGKATFHARQISDGTYKLNYICEMISARSAVSSADVKSVLDSFSWIMGVAFTNGYHLELEELGYFSPSLRTRGTGEGKYTVEVDGVNFRCSTELLGKIKKAKLKKVKGADTSENFEERKKRMLEYMSRNSLMSPRTYAECTGCTRYRAEADIKQLVTDGVLEKVGYRKQTIYVLKK